MSAEEKTVLNVDGIVALRDKKPYVRLLLNEKPIVQMSMAQARKIANDILIQASRVEADAMIHSFFGKQSFPQEAANALMLEFRGFRKTLDDEPVEGSEYDPTAMSAEANSPEAFER